MLRSVGFCVMPGGAEGGRMSRGVSGCSCVSTLRHAKGLVDGMRDGRQYCAFATAAVVGFLGVDGIVIQGLDVRGCSWLGSPNGGCPVEPVLLGLDVESGAGCPVVIGEVRCRR